MDKEKDTFEANLATSCPCCGSENIYAITRVTGYFSKTSMWNKGKIAELKDRERTANRQYFSEEK